MSPNPTAAQQLAVLDQGAATRAHEAVLALVSLYGGLLNVEREEKKQLVIANAKLQQKIVESERALKDALMAVQRQTARAIIEKLGDSTLEKTLSSWIGAKFLGVDSIPMQPVELPPL